MDYSALVAFLSDLAANNNKPWFDEHRPTYDRLRGEWIELVGQVIEGVSQFDPGVGIVLPKDTQLSASIVTSASRKTRARTRPPSARRSVRRAATAGCRSTTSRLTKRAV